MSKSNKGGEPEMDLQGDESGQASKATKAAIKMDVLADDKPKWPANYEMSRVQRAKYSQAMKLDDLVDGQVLSLNIGSHTFFSHHDLREIKLSVHGQTEFVFKDSDYDEIQKSLILRAIHAGTLILGTTQGKLNKRTISIEEDTEKILEGNNYENFFKEIGRIVSKRTRISGNGAVYSPATDLDALMKAEEKGKKRKKWLDLLRRVMRHGPHMGGVSFIEKNTEQKAISFGSEKGGTGVNMGRAIPSAASLQPSRAPSGGTLARDLF